MNTLGHVGIIVQDARKMKVFYEELLGLRIDFETDDKAYVQYTVPQCEHRVDLEHMSLIQEDMPGSRYCGAFLRVETDNLEAVRQLCDAFGGKVVRAPVKKDYGKTEMYIEDPEGNLIQVYAES